jgi:hypothetical protein
MHDDKESWPKKKQKKQRNFGVFLTTGNQKDNAQ